jgi:endonuclease/exonuclease/phosphatase family metal-dependent hydrolase
VFFRARPAAPAEPPVNALAIVSWNIHEGAGDTDDLIARLRGGEFTAGERIDHFVLLLQEAMRRDDGVPPRIPRGYPGPRRIHGSSRSDESGVRRLADDGYAVFYAPSMRNGEPVSGRAEDRGNAIVSTLPLSDPTVIELPFERQRRVAVAASVTAQAAGGQWQLHVVDIHLDTALALLHGGPLAARHRQARALIDAIATAIPEADATIVIGGDLNTWLGNREPAAALLQQEFPEARQQIAGPSWTGPLGLHARLDHIFVRGTRSPARVTRLPSKFGSDHYPLLSMIRF